MKLLHLAIIIASMLTTPACGKEIPMGPTLLLELEEQYNAKLAELKEMSLNHVSGWPSDHDCDAALWAGIARSAGATWVEMDAALQSDGRPTRRPLRDCVTPDESKATTSNDMITGIILGLQAAKDDRSIYKLYQYGEEHNWIMGYPEWYVARVLLRPNGITLLARVLYQLTDGKRDYAIRLAPILYGPVQADYEQHLILLSRIIEQRAGGPQYGMEVAEKILAKTSPLDALAQAVAGNYTQAAILLTGDYTAPTYVRGHESYPLVHWLLAAKITLDGALSR